MKKIIVCLVVCVASALPSAALTDALLEGAIYQAQQAQQAQKAKIPALSAQQMERFPKYLEMAEVVMKQDKQFYLNPAFLGEALLNSVSTYMRVTKNSATPAELTYEEQRAVYFAVYTLLPKKNREGMMSIKEYMDKYPISNWGYFSQASQTALELVYRAVQDIATEQPNYQYTWLKLLTH